MKYQAVLFVSILVGFSSGCTPSPKQVSPEKPDTALTEPKSSNVITIPTHNADAPQEKSAVLNGPQTLRNLDQNFSARSTSDVGLRIKDTDILFAASWKAPLTEKSSMEERYNSHPSIVVGKNGEWKSLELTGFERYGWESPLYFTNAGEVWAFLDYTVEGRMHAVPVIYSADFGQTWEVRSSIEKPKFTYAIQRFQMSAKGEGFATFKDTEDQIAYAITKDRGLTWTIGKPPKIKNSLLSATSSKNKSRFCLSKKHAQPQACPKN